MRNRETGDAPKVGSVRVEHSQVDRVYRQAANDFRALAGQMREDARANIEPLLTEAFTAIHSIVNLLVSIDSRIDSANQTLDELVDLTTQSNQKLDELVDLLTPEP